MLNLLIPRSSPEFFKCLYFISQYIITNVSGNIFSMYIPLWVKVREKWSEKCLTKHFGEENILPNEEGSPRELIKFLSSPILRRLVLHNLINVYQLAFKLVISLANWYLCSYSLRRMRRRKTNPKMLQNLKHLYLFVYTKMLYRSCTQSHVTTRHTTRVVWNLEWFPISLSVDNGTSRFVSSS